jgi:hypothetical protein
MDLKSFTKSSPNSHNEPKLTDSETENAMNKLLISEKTFPKINRRFEDKMDYQNGWTLFSFIKHEDYEFLSFLKKIDNKLSIEDKKELKNLLERKNLICGIGKVRGSYRTVEEANDAARYIIQNIDSSNSIFTCQMGVPFPLVNEGLSQEVSKIDVKNLVEKTISDNIRNKRIQEQREKEQILERQEALQSDIKEDPILSELENYITNRVKLAHLRYSIDAHKTERVKNLKHEKDCIDFLLDLQKKHPNFEEKYMEHYSKGRKATGVSDDYAFDGFMNYMTEPLIYRSEENI